MGAFEIVRSPTNKNLDKNLERIYFLNMIEIEKTISRFCGGQ